MALSEIPAPALPVDALDAVDAVDGIDPTVDGPPRAPKLRRMSFGLLLVYVAILAVNSGGNGILLPNIVAGLDEAAKIGNLAIVTTVAFVANIFAQPVAGALSDATRSRFGRRTPWMVGGALLTSGFLLGLPMAQSVLTVALVWLVVQVGVNAIQAAATALVPDRYPASRRGGVSAMIGVGITIGNAVGAIVAGSTASRGMLPYAFLAVLVLVIIGGFVVVNREAPSTDLPRERTSAKDFLRGFWVDPRQYPDFAWAFGSRFLMVIGFYGAQTYGLYILRDYIGLSDAESNSFAATMGVVLLVGVLLSALVSGWLSDRVGRRKPFIVWSSVVMSVALAIPLAVPTTTGVLAYAFLLGLGFGAYISIDLALMTEVLPARLQGASSAGRDLAILGLATTLPQAMSPSIAAGLVTLTGGYPVLFVAGIVFVMLGALAVRPIKAVR
jgi:MFS family permease